MKKLLLLVCVLMTGCAVELISSNEKTIVVQARRQDVAKAQDIAETECQKRGLHARLTSKPANDQFGFDCVR